MAKRITLRKGSEKKVVILEADPVPSPGNEVWWKDQCWIVSKVEETQVLARIPWPQKGATHA